MSDDQQFILRTAAEQAIHKAFGHSGIECHDRLVLEIEKVARAYAKSALVAAEKAMQGQDMFQSKYSLAVHEKEDAARHITSLQRDLVYYKALSSQLEKQLNLVGVPAELAERVERQDERDRHHEQMDKIHSNEMDRLREVVRSKERVAAIGKTALVEIIKNPNAAVAFAVDAIHQMEGESGS